jgi:type IV secretory pathway VirB2 component (pilin)
MNTLKKISIHLVVLSFFIIPALLLADGQTTPNTGTSVKFEIKNPLKGGEDSLTEVIVTILNNVVMPIAAVAVVIWIIYAGFTFLTAQGKEAEIRKAKDRLLWSLVGAGILLGAVGISKVVENTVKDLIKPLAP